ncbi:Rz1-like lysis system protein LysC [Serratia marcescens]|uniref:Rz1-like lysis system protein LysC n=1 Tax=Serratia marcescens TaxID=615 RepID=UPI001D00EC51|nr:Rz1-like lysis system protein LysC [Serratia marcescens]
MLLKTTSAPAVLLLVLFLASCAERTPPPPPAQIVLFPPESVFTPCEQPKLQGDTWGGIGSHALALQTALSICAAQIEMLRNWRDMNNR